MAQLGSEWQQFTYTDKGGGLVAALREAGHKIQRRDGLFYTLSSPAAVESFIASYDGVAAEKAAKDSEIRAYADALRKAALAGYSTEERDSWPEKVAEARRHTGVEPANESAAIAAGVHMLWIEAQARGASVSDVAARVSTKAAQLRAFEAAVAGVSGAHRDAVDATDEGSEAATIAAVKAYDYSTGWPGA